MMCRSLCVYVAVDTCARRTIEVCSSREVDVHSIEGVVNQGFRIFYGLVF